MALQDLYQTSDDSTNGGYDVDTILEICTPNWFHGFLSSADAQKGLKGKADGTFLFRFSTTNPGCYSLSAAYSGTVGHCKIFFWKKKNQLKNNFFLTKKGRISCCKDPGKPPTFKIDGREYQTLNEIITTHKFGKEAFEN